MHSSEGKRFHNQMNRTCSYFDFISSFYSWVLPFSKASLPDQRGEEEELSVVCGDGPRLDPVLDHTRFNEAPRESDVISVPSLGCLSFQVASATVLVGVK